MKTEKQIIKNCANGQKTAQYELVRRYSGMLMSVARRYSTDDSTAKDILQEAFIRIFDKIDQYKTTGSFEAWMRTITMRCALNWIKLKSNQVFSSIVEVDEDTKTANDDILDKLGSEEIISLIQTLPPGFKAVFNMYSIEGYSHKEIGEILEITESASRSQLSRARVLLKTKVKQLESINYRTA